MNEKRNTHKDTQNTKSYIVSEKYTRNPVSGTDTPSQGP